MGSIKRNPLATDPYLQQGLDNLSKLFAPPNSGDIANYAKAKAIREEADRLSANYSYASDPNYNREQADRLNYAVNGNANNTFYKVDQADATQRYGLDLGARTELEKQRLSDARAFAEKRYGPIGENQILPDMPASVADYYRLPASDAQTGIITLQPGEQATFPNGRVLKGADKPLNESEWEAAQRERLRLAGSLTDEMMLDTINGKQTPVQVMGPDGKTPRYVTPGQAVREGLRPAPPVSSAAPETQNYQTAEGKRGTAVFDPTSRSWLDTASGRPIPEGSITFNSSLQGGAADTGLGPTTTNTTSGNNQGAQITSALNTLDVYENLIRNNPGALGVVGLIRGTAQNAGATVQDLADQFGKDVPELRQAADEIRNGLKSVAPRVFDPSIPEAQFLQATLAYAMARTENPSGEVSRQAYDRALERISGGLLGNSQETLANINAYRKVLQQQLTGVDALRNPNSARRDTAFPGTQTTPKPPSPSEPPRPPQAEDVEQWDIGPNGKPVRVK